MKNALWKIFAPKSKRPEGIPYSMKPGPALFIAALLILILSCAAYFFPFLFIIWLYAGLVLILFAAADFLILLLFTDKFEIRREILQSLAQDRQAKVRLIVSREGNLVPAKIRLFDMHPLSMECNCFPALIDRRLFSSGKGSVNFDYTLIPRERGPWFFRGAELLLTSPLRFWARKAFRKCESSGRTYPDFNKIKAATNLRALLERAGVKNIRRRGHGLEFMSLRDYQEGDSLKDVDWRAASRRRALDGQVKLIVREYQEEQDQQVLFLLDTGYRLHKKENADSKRTQFDSALEAALLLSWVSLKHGDSVAAAAFGKFAEGKTTRWIFPRKGISSFPRLMNGLYDLASSPAASSPFSCLEEALAKLKRRTFIIIISNFREEDGESLSWILKRIERRHLLLLVSLREKESLALAARHPGNPEEALETAAAFSYLNSRRELYQSWEHSGLLTLEVSPEKLSPALINRYLQVKKSGRL
ncbi:MAG: DUF58 domain-containing protein [Treponema sp.]|jgi:uncharacterized protein (DUF58 family)|nr:DUF58 domain-containing protein [Treponema sp.]